MRLDIKRNENIEKRKQESRQKFLQHVSTLALHFKIMLSSFDCNTTVIFITYCL